MTAGPAGPERPYCPVCGFWLDEPAWTDDEHPSMEICPSCGIQFGYTDMAARDPEERARLWQEWRERWIADGCPWRGAELPPRHFDPEAQLRRVTARVPDRRSRRAR